MTGSHHLLTRGPSPAEAALTVVLVHGRGGSARDMLTLGEAMDRDDIAWWAPQAAARTWYPLSFLAPVEANEPHLSASLATLDEVVRSAWAQGWCWVSPWPPTGSASAP